MEKIKLTEAIELYQKRKGVQKIRDMEIAEKIFPKSSIESRRLNMSKLKNGITKRVDVPLIQLICSELGVDANFLFDVKSMKR